MRFLSHMIQRFLDRATYGQSVIALLLINGVACGVTSQTGRLAFRTDALFPSVTVPLFWLLAALTFGLLLATGYILLMSLIVNEMQKVRRGDKSWFMTQAVHDRNRLLDEWAAEAAKERTRS